LDRALVQYVGIGSGKADIVLMAKSFCALELEMVDLLDLPPRRFAPPLLARRGDGSDLPGIRIRKLTPARNP
jgi:hypothetical protein